MNIAALFRNYSSSEYEASSHPLGSGDLIVNFTGTNGLDPYLLFTSDIIVAKLRTNYVYCKNFPKSIIREINRVAHTSYVVESTYIYTTAGLDPSILTANPIPWKVSRRDLNLATLHRIKLPNLFPSKPICPQHNALYYAYLESHMRSIPEKCVSISIYIRDAQPGAVSLLTRLFQIVEVKSRVAPF